MNSWKLLTIFSVSLWLGAMIFFSLIVTPQAFSVLKRESAGLLVSTVFPRYYLFGIALGILAFARLHRLSVALNLATMLAGLTLVFVEGLEPAA